MDRRSTRKMVSKALQEIHADVPLTVEHTIDILKSFVMINDAADRALLHAALLEANEVAAALPFPRRWPGFGRKQLGRG